MMLPLSIAAAHLRSRRRQTLVSVLGVALGVGVFIAVTGLMGGFQSYFRTQMIDSNPHVTITDEVRQPAAQPLAMLHPRAAVAVARILPRDPVRGIANAGEIMAALAAMPGVAVAPTLRGQMLLRRAGRDYAVNAIGIDPVRESAVTTLSRDMRQGSLEALGSRPDGIVIGLALADKMGAALGDTISVATSAGGESALRVVGIFRTGLEQLDTGQVYVALNRQQSMQARPRVINEIHVKLADISRSREVAALAEGRWGYKAAPWEETFARILEVFVLQNVIIYGSTGSILLVAGFGIFNIISTVVSEKARDIAIMRSIGMPRGSVVATFIVEGIAVGVMGVAAGWLLGGAGASVIETFPAPGSTDGEGGTLMVLQSPATYGLAAGIALLSSVVAAWIPARKAARTDPLVIIRGAT
ncbi:MAG: ABC transporter permease [Acetobacteraceae bacterium]|nr:ABC transporter permease [Acetobacteraceae bacterium]